MKRRTPQEEYDLLAELDREERCMGLYGPYDPRAEEVMEGWREPGYRPTPHTAEWRDEEADYWRSKACRLGTAAENKKGAYTQEEIESGERFNEECLRLAHAISLGKLTRFDDAAQEVERSVAAHEHWPEDVKREWRELAAKGDTRALIRNRHLI